MRVGWIQRFGPIIVINEAVKRCLQSLSAPLNLSTSQQTRARSAGLIAA